MQNLQWTQDLLEKSFEDELRDKVLEMILDVEDIYMGGPTYFCPMILLPTSSTKYATRELVKRILDMKLTLLKGENVD